MFYGICFPWSGDSEVHVENRSDAQAGWIDYITSVAEIEKDTGYKFFDTLTASTASALKVVVDKEATGGRKGGSEKETAVATTEEPKATSTSSTQAPIQLVATQAAPVVETPAPVVLPDGPSLIVYRKKTDGPIETRTANVKRSKEVVEVTKEDGALLILNSNLVLVILPLPPKEEVKLSPEQIDLALSKYDEAEKDGSIKELLQEGHTKWTALKAPVVVEAPVVASVQPPQETKEPELDVPTAAGIEEPELPAWRVWYEKARDWIGKYLH